MNSTIKDSLRMIELSAMFDIQYDYKEDYYHIDFKREYRDENCNLFARIHEELPIKYYVEIFDANYFKEINVSKLDMLREYCELLIKEEIKYVTQ